MDTKITSTLDEKKALKIKALEVAQWYLKRKGHEVIVANTSLQSKLADIISKDGDELVFIEVRARKAKERGFPEEVNTDKKREKYEKIAQDYLFNNTLPSMGIRFDVVGVLLSDDGKAFLRHHRDVFGVSIDI